MEKCTKCFHKNVCTEFNILQNETTTACGQFLDESLILKLPCALGTKVYERTKNCEKCPEFTDVAYSDYVNCENECSLFDFSFNKHDNCEECFKHIKNVEKTFDLSMVSRYGKDIFLTENVAYIDLPKEIYILAGYSYGVSCYENFVKKAFNSEKPITIVFPEHIKRVSPSFINGFFNTIMERWSIRDLCINLEIVSQIPNLKEEIIKELL